MQFVGRLAAARNARSWHEADLCLAQLILAAGIAVSGFRASQGMQHERLCLLRGIHMATQYHLDSMTELSCRQAE